MGLISRLTEPAADQVQTLMNGCLGGARSSRKFTSTALRSISISGHTAIVNIFSQRSVEMKRGLTLESDRRKRQGKDNENAQGVICRALEAFDRRSAWARVGLSARLSTRCDLSFSTVCPVFF